MPTLLEQLREALAADFAVERELASGGMGSVFLAHDRKLDRRVAIKILKPELASATASERFVREARTVAQLKHPCIVPIYRAGEVAGLSYYVMEFVEGETLRDRLARGPLAPDAVVKLADDLLAGLEAAHANGIVHRDVKPANVILVGQQAVLVDFGVAKRLEPSGDELTATDHVVGTPAYMAPEQIAGEDVSPATDVYAAGMVLYEAVTGRPWMRSNASQASWEGVPSWLSGALQRALTFAPSERWRDAAAFRRALAVATPKPGRARWKRVAAATSVVAVVVVSAVLAVLSRGGDAGAGVVPDRVAVMTFRNETGDPSLDPLGVMTADWINQGLVETGLAKVVPISVSLPDRERDRDAVDEAGRPSAVGFGRRTGAALVVTGAYYRVGETLHVRAEVVDPESEAVVRAIPPADAPLAEPLAAVNVLRDRVMAAVATLLDVRTSVLAEVASQPPTYEAYREYVAAVDLLLDGDEEAALAHLLRAHEVDSTYTLPLLTAVLVTDDEQGDSLLGVVAMHRERLPPFDAQILEMIEAIRRAGETMSDEDADRVILREFRQLLELAPDPLWTTYMMFWASWGDRPKLVLELAANLDREADYARLVGEGILIEAYHAVGDHRRELEEIRAGLTGGALSDVEFDRLVTALAALGRTRELSDAIAEAGHLPLDDQRNAMELAARELYAHGHEQEFRTFLDETIAWYESRPETENPAGYNERDAFFGTDEIKEIVEMQRDYSHVLYLAGRLVEAEDVYESIWVPNAEDDVVCNLRMARFAARRGDEQETARVAACFDPPKSPWWADASPEFWQARLAALLGRKDEAVRHLRSWAGDHWVSTYPSLHRDFDLLLGLRGYPPFEDLLRPKG
jgi:serine/threonine-protein kinase